MKLAMSYSFGGMFPHIMKYTHVNFQPNRAATQLIISLWNGKITTKLFFYRKKPHSKSCVFSFRFPYHLKTNWQGERISRRKTKKNLELPLRTFEQEHIPISSPRKSEKITRGRRNYLTPNTRNGKHFGQNRPQINLDVAFTLFLVWISEKAIENWCMQFRNLSSSTLFFYLNHKWRLS